MVELVDENATLEWEGDEVLEEGIRCAQDVDELMTISLQAFTGVNGYQTIRVTGYHGKRPLQVLIDTGSTHKFIDQEMAKKLECKACDISTGANYFCL